MLQITILGTGIAELQAVYDTIYEANSYAGGLCASFEIEGFGFDRADHLSFTTSTLVKKTFDETPYHCHYLF